MISVTIPCLNEEKNLERTVNTVFQAAVEAGNFSLDIIIVNDGSTDRTAEVIASLQAEHPSIQAVTHVGNKGLGKSIRDAILVAKYPKFCFVPGDNDVPKEMLVTLFSKREKADLILTFFLNKEHRGRTRNILSSLFQWIYMGTFNIYVQYLNCPGMYSTEKVRGLGLKSDRMSIVAEMNTKMLCTGCTYLEIPGYMQTGLEQSQSLTCYNFLEVVQTYIFICYEIKFKKKSMFGNKPKRICE
jgi:glycosyltransferase involved in cell wall biosynthesis